MPGSLDEADVEPGDLRTRLCQKRNRSLVPPPVKFRILKIHAAETRREKRPPQWEAPDFPRQRPAHCPLTRGNVGGPHTAGNDGAETALGGWGGRIRTSEGGFKIRSHGAGSNLFRGEERHERGCREGRQRQRSRRLAVANLGVAAAVFFARRLALRLESSEVDIRDGITPIHRSAASQRQLRLLGSRVAASSHRA
jgi:hypothetical protein